MDYRELIKNLRFLSKYERNREYNDISVDETMADAAQAIEKALEEADYLKGLLKDAQSRAEKAEKERDVYKEMIYKERPCFFCAEYTGSWNPDCIGCDRSTKEYRSKFRLREHKEE